MDDSASLQCLLCTEKFTYTLRRHHCRACGILCCDNCSTKRLRLAAKGKSAVGRNGTSPTPSPSGGKQVDGERVCDGCFNRLSFNSFQWSLAEAKARKEEKRRKEKLAAEQQQQQLKESSSTGNLFSREQQEQKGGVAAAGASAAVHSALASGADAMIALKEREERLKQTAIKAEEMSQVRLVVHRCCLSAVLGTLYTPLLSWLLVHDVTVVAAVICCCCVV